MEQNKTNLPPVSEFDQLHAHQNKRCAICNKKTPLSSMTVDELHQLICPRCKVVLSRTDRDPRILIKAAEYLAGMDVNPYWENSVLCLL